jgi:hypothetical protein
MNPNGPDFYSFLNALGKLVGFIFAIGFGVLSIWSFVSVQFDLAERVVVGGLGALISFLGVLMIIAKPTRPPED